MRVLGIETSCDETAVGVVERGTQLLSSVIGSQVEVHARYGGIVPEVASRQHVLAMLPIYREALDRAGVSPRSLDAVAVTVGPGLAGALLVGANFAKGLAMALGVPLLGVNHLEGHVYAAWLEEGVDPARSPGFPLVCLLASGGHTDLLLMEEHGRYTLLGATRDDAAGEAFDKAARVLGLGFPGGPEIQRLADNGVGRGEAPAGLDAGEPGLQLLRREDGAAPPRPGPGRREEDDDGVSAPEGVPAQLAAGFQEAVVDVLVHKTVEAAKQHRARGVLLGGGVAANTLLREELARRCPLPVVVPRPSLCTDNGAMVAAAAYFAPNPAPRPSALDQDVVPSLRLGLAG